MKTIYIPLFFTIALLLASCIKDPDGKSGNNTNNGKITNITLKVKSGLLQSVSAKSKALSPQQEGMINNMHILVFDAAGKIVSNEYFTDLSINGSGNISANTFPGENMQIYAVANSDIYLNDIKTLSQLKALLIMVKGNGLTGGERLTTGNATVNINQTNNSAIPLQLYYLSAKVTVTVKDNTPDNLDINIIGWDIINIPKQTFLTERVTPAQEDAVTGNQPTDYISTNNKYGFENIDAAAKTWGQSFYIFENRRGERVNREDPTNPDEKYPGMNVSDNKQEGKAWYAPPGATYMIIYGTHTKNGEMNNIIYKVYLGEDPVKDYNVFRGRHYIYNVTINGLNNINIDSNVDWGSASFSITTSDNFMMDAHPDFRILRIGGTSVNSVTPAYATVEVLDPSGTLPCNWLSVSPLNLYYHSIKQSGNINQQFAPDNGIGSFVRPRYNPVPVTELEFTNATFAITRKLTKIPFNQTAVYSYQNVIVYADAYGGLDERSAKVRITYYKGTDGTEVAGQQTFDITQSGAIKISDDLYIERYEESAMLIYPNLAADVQNNSMMQWGYNNNMLYSGADRYTNGNYLTANAVYNTVLARNGMENPLWTNNTYVDYREKFPRLGVKVVEPSNLLFTDPVYYYPALESSTPLFDYYNPVFNSSAARYCHEKNRDINGDGVIAADETFWYLPSMADMYYISRNMSADLSLLGSYWTATEENSTTSWAYTFPQKKVTNSDKTIPYRVRCVRGKGVAALPIASIESREEDKTKLHLHFVEKAYAQFIGSDRTGLTWTITSGDTTWLKISKSAFGIGLVTSYSSNYNSETFYAFATANNAYEQRSTTMILSRPGMEDIHLEVIQKSQPEWAGCNVYWEPDFNNSDGTTGRLTFDDVGVTAHNNYQGVYFQWGSLVAMSPLGYYTSNSILFSPTGKKDYAYNAIPYAGIVNIPEDRTMAYLLEIHDPSQNIGDICKYITDRGWAPGSSSSKKWRMPVSNEFDDESNYTKFGSFASIVTTNTNGQMEFSSGYRRIDSDFPASGYRKNTDGSINSTGSGGYYWSSSPSGTSGYTLNFNTGIVFTSTSNTNRRMGYTVRCVLDKGK